MEVLKEILKALASVKKLIAIMLTIVFCYLSVKGDISSTEFMTVFSLIVGSYFGQSIAKATK